MNQKPFSLEALRDLVGEMFRSEAISGTLDSMPWTVLRRDVKGFEIRRIQPIKVASCLYNNRGEGMTILDRYFNGGNEKEAQVPRYRPLLLRFEHGVDATEKKVMMSGINSSKPPASGFSNIKVSNMAPMTVASLTFQGENKSSFSKVSPGLLFSYFASRLAFL